MVKRCHILSSFIVLERELSQIVVKCCTWFVMCIDNMGSHHHDCNMSSELLSTRIQ